MSVADWLRVFRTLHEAAKKGELRGSDAKDYQSGCDELARALLAGQRITPKPGEVPRQILHVARALQVDLETSVSRVRATTVDLWVGGFSVLLAKPPPPGEEPTATLRVPGNESIAAAVVPADVKQQPGSVRVAFTFKKLNDADQRRVELLVIDTALSQIAT
jgi:hypothetical protein